ncbi:Diphthine--ammonia ligase [Halotydeus destructor]|nr:Diphthine--ammonia ligase [Halotydeus destructor]
MLEDSASWWSAKELISKTISNTCAEFGFFKGLKMKVVALISGGKDSCYNMCKCVDDGHEIVALANLYPPHQEDGDELDSYMYQTVGHQAIDAYASAMGVPLFRREITGKPISQEYEYTISEEDEVEDLYRLLVDIRSQGIEYDAISVGAIMSNYQGNRAQNICDRLQIKMLAYLWERNQEELLQEMIDYGVKAILIKVAVIGLDKEHLGKTLSDMQSTLLKLKDKYGINVCGEGGEYETLTLDCPLFKSKLIIDSFQTKLHSNDAFAPVSYLRPTKVSLVAK